LQIEHSKSVLQKKKLVEAEVETEAEEAEAVVAPDMEVLVIAKVEGVEVHLMEVDTTKALTKVATTKALTKADLVEEDSVVVEAVGEVVKEIVAPQEVEVVAGEEDVEAEALVKVEVVDTLVGDTTKVVVVVVDTLVEDTTKVVIKEVEVDSAKVVMTKEDMVVVVAGNRLLL